MKKNKVNKGAPMNPIPRLLVLLLLISGTGILNAQEQLSAPSLQKIESIFQEENEPITFKLSVNGFDKQTVWQLVGTSAAGKSILVNASSAVLNSAGVWRILFPGQPQGTYYIHATDSNGNQAVLSDALTVTEHSPVLVSMTPTKVDPLTPLTLTLTGKYIQSDAKAELISDKDGKTVAGTVKLDKDPTLTTLTFPGMAPGVYSLQITSAKQKANRLDAVLKVGKPAPILSGFNQKANWKVAQVPGSNWTEGMKAFILSESEKKQEVVLFSPKSDSISVAYENNLGPGTYDLLVVNDEGRESTLKNALVIKDELTPQSRIWVGGGVDMVSNTLGTFLQPTVTANYCFLYRTGLTLGLETGVSYLVQQFPLSSNTGTGTSVTGNNLPSYWLSQWFGATLKEPNDREYMTFRVPLGMKFFSMNMSYLYSGITLDYELNRDWVAEVGYERILDFSAPVQSSIRFTALRQF